MSCLGAMAATFFAALFAAGYALSTMDMLDEDRVTEIREKVL